MTREELAESLDRQGIPHNLHNSPEQDAQRAAALTEKKDV